MIPIFFNLVVNSLLSISISLIFVYFFIWFFRIEVGREKLFLLSLPFFKIVYDFMRGVPQNSVLFSGIDPFSLPPRHQLLSIGAGFDGWTPFLSTVFSVNALDGNTYNSSIGDYILFWLNRSFGNLVPFIIVISIFIISFYFLTIRAIQYYRFEVRRRKDRLKLLSFKKINLRRRVVDIYISKEFTGSPFTGGFFSPYICIPHEAFQILNIEELEAVIAHELGHIKSHDLIFTVLIQILGDIFWFVPGYRWLSKKIDSIREIVADNWAISENSNQYFLASALLKLQKLLIFDQKYVLYSAFFRQKSLLKQRVERLIGDSKECQSRFGWQNRWLRLGIIVFISFVVLNSVIGGNYTDEEIRHVPKWVEGLFKTSCYCVSRTFYATV